jgi:hypothetical protein
MTLLMAAVIIALALLGPLFGADSRDGRDWKQRDEAWRTGQKCR